MTPIAPLRVSVGLLDFSAEVQNLTFSNSDPGGYEMASFDVQGDRANRILPGAPVVISDGLQTVWRGRVAEPAKAIQHGFLRHRRVGAATTTVSCEGSGAELKDNLMSMIYVDRDLSRWVAPSLQRQKTIAGLNLSSGNVQTGADPVTANPALIMEIDDSWVAPFTPFNEALYDAGPGNLINTVYLSLTTVAENPVDANWSEAFFLCDDANVTSFVGGTNLHPASTGYISIGGPNGRRCALLQQKYSLTPAGSQGAVFLACWANVTVYGQHGLPGRGPDPVGFYCSDIAQHAASRAIAAGSDLRLGRFDQLDNFIVPHYTQQQPVAHDTILTDMAQLAPAHYGVWASSSLFDDTPEVTFRAYSTRANVFTTLADCDEADVSERLANMFTSAIVTFTDAGGSPFQVTVSLPNAILNQQETSRTTTFDLGISSPEAARAFASFALQTLYAQARTAGSIQLPRNIRDTNGAAFKSYRLRSGIDRIRIADLPVRSSLLAASDSDSFRISRVECSVDTTSGQVQTRVEIDAGPNLIETLQARFAIAQQLAGAF